MSSEEHRNGTAAPRVLNAYLLGCLDFDELLSLQRRLLYDVSGNRSTGILLFCEHQPGISIGREGSAGHVRMEKEELRRQGWPVRWVNRGGGCLLSAPGQVAVYPIVALDQLGWNLQEYLDRLHEVLAEVLESFSIHASVRPGRAGAWVGERQLAHVGVAVRGGVTCFGFALNVNPDLRLFRSVQCDGAEEPMTSLEREHRGRVRPTAVRQRLLEVFQQRFAFDRLALFHHHPALAAKVPVHAVVARSR